MVVKNPKYKPLYLSDKRYFLITGGRNSGKSFEVSTFQTLLTFESDHNILFTRYTMTSAGKSIIPELEDKIDQLECSKSFNISQNEIINKNTGSKIIFSGIKTGSGNQTANLKSLHDISTWVLDEAEEMSDEKEFDKIDLSIRSTKRQNRIILVLNPTTKEHWIWKRWFENSYKMIEIDGEQIPISTSPEICHIHTTYLDNIQNIPKDYLQRINNIKETNREKYRHVILGGWLHKAEGVIFENWEEGEFDESLPYNFGLDFGWNPDPTALCKVAIDNKNKRLYVKELCYDKNLSQGQIVDILKAHVKNSDLIVADSADQRMVDEIYQRGFNIVSAKKGPGSIVEGIKFMQDFKIIVHPESHNYKKELINYAWSSKKSGIPIDRFQHLIDATRYSTEELRQPAMFFG